MNALPPHLYSLEARRRGVDGETIHRAVQVTRTVSEHGATPILTLKHLAELTGASYRYLRDVVARRRDPYLGITRPKKNGETRAISSPEPVLMDVQRWILHRVLATCNTHAASFAYQQGRSIVDCAAMHVGARWLVKVDVHNFFPSIREREVFPIFADLGYPRLLSLELTRICTRITGPGDPVMRHDRYQGKAPYDVSVTGSLPQGAPTSGMLANVVMKQADQALMVYADEQGLVFTRYSDDIVFSCTGEFSREKASAVVRRAAQTLKSQGLSIHWAKTRIITPGARKVVLGLLVDGDQPRLLPEFKRRLDVHLRGVERFGLPQHATHRHFASILSMVNHVDGCIAFASSVDRDYADKFADRWDSALRAGGYPR